MGVFLLFGWLVWFGLVLYMLNYILIDGHWFLLWNSTWCLAQMLSVWPLIIHYSVVFLNWWCELLRLFRTTVFAAARKWPLIRTYTYYFPSRNLNIPTWGSSHAKSHTCEKFKSCERFFTDYQRIACMCKHLLDSNISGLGLNVYPNVWLI